MDRIEAIGSRIEAVGRGFEVVGRGLRHRERVLGDEGGRIGDGGGQARPDDRLAGLLAGLLACGYGGTGIAKAVGGH